MSEMVERLAKQLAARSDYPADKWAEFEDLARFVIHVMREPTQDILDTVRRSKPFDRDIADSWPIAIDAALK